MTEEFTWDAFISYRRSDGTPVARAIRKELTRFKFPETHPPPARPPGDCRIYLDTAYGRTTDDFYLNHIRPAILSSRFLVLVLTPDLFEREEASVDWVDREIRDFLGKRSPDRMILVRGRGGDDDQQLPESLRVLENPQITDMRKVSRLRLINWWRRYEILDAVAELVPAIFQTDPRHLPMVRRENARERTKFMRQASAVLLGLVLVFTLLATYAFQQREEARLQEIDAVAISLSSRAIALQEGGRHDEQAAQLARQAYLIAETGSGKALSAADRALRTILSAPYFNRVVGGHESDVWSVAIGAAGSAVAAAGTDGDVSIWKPEQLVRDPFVLRRADDAQLLAGHGGGPVLRGSAPAIPVAPMAWSADSRFVLARRTGIGAQFWDLRSRVLSAVDIPVDDGDVTAITFVPDGRQFVLGLSSGQLCLGSVHLTGISCIDAHTGAVRALSFGPTYREFVSVGDDGRVLYWTTASASGGFKHEEIGRHADRSFSVLFGPDGQTVFSAGADRVIKIWERGGEGWTSRDLGEHRQPVLALALSPDGKQLASGGQDNRIMIWELERERTEPTVLETEHWIQSLSFAPDGRLASGDYGGAVRIWENDPARIFPQRRLSAGGLYRLAVSPDGGSVVVGDDRGGAYVWSLREPDGPVVKLEHPRGWVTAVAFRSNNVIATASTDRQIRLWELNETEPGILRSWQAGESIWDLEFGPESRRLYAAAESGALQVYDVRGESTDHEVVWRGNGRLWAIDEAGGFMATAGGDGVVTIRSGGNLSSVNQVTRPGVGAHSVALSADGLWFVVGRKDGAVELYSMKRPNRLKRRFDGHVGTVSEVIFSADAQYIYSAGLDGTVRIWNREGSHPPIVIDAHTNVRGLALTPDGETMISAGADGKVVARITRTSTLAERVCGLRMREFNEVEWSGFVDKRFKYVRCPSDPGE